MIDIQAANLRDASWITAHMRPIDREECYCQLPDDLPTVVLAEWLLRNSRAFVAHYHGQPAMLFGTAPMTVNCFSVWGIGTAQAERTIPGVSRFMLDHEIERRIDEGFNCAEARSIVAHGKAHRWIESLGGVKAGPAFLYGKGGEHFVLYRWTVAEYRSIREKSRWS